MNRVPTQPRRQGVVEARRKVRAKTKEDRRRRVTTRYDELLKRRKTPKEIISILCDEESKSPKTIYSILEGWR